MKKKQKDKYEIFSGHLVKVGWFLALIAFVIFEKARPSTMTVYDKFYNSYVRTSWDTNLGITYFFIMLTSFCISLAAFFINLMRNDKTHKEFRLSLILLIFVTFSGWLFYLLKVGL